MLGGKLREYGVLMSVMDEFSQFQASKTKMYHSEMVVLFWQGMLVAKCFQLLHSCANGSHFGWFRTVVICLKVRRGVKFSNSCCVSSIDLTLFVPVLVYVIGIFMAKAVPTPYISPFF
jgi:hypothetical protein